MTRVLMVYTGNIYRSTMTRQVFAGAVGAVGLNTQIHVDSVGGPGEERGNPIDRQAARVLHGNGHDIPDHYACQAGLYKLDEQDLIFAMTGHHLAALNRLRDRAGLCGQGRSDPRLFRDFNPQARSGNTNLPNPWYGDYFNLIETLEVIECTAPAVLEHPRGL